MTTQNKIYDGVRGSLAKMLKRTLWYRAKRTVGNMLNFIKRLFRRKPTLKQLCLNFCTLRRELRLAEQIEQEFQQELKQNKPKDSDGKLPRTLSGSGTTPLGVTLMFDSNYGIKRQNATLKLIYDKIGYNYSDEDLMPYIEDKSFIQAFREMKDEYEEEV